MSRPGAIIASLGLVVALAPAVVGVSPAQAVSGDVVISQVYGGGGNAGAPYTNDFVELFNRGGSTVSLAGKSVQYASNTGTGVFGSFVTLLNGTVQPGQYYLVQMASGGAIGAPLPTPDATGTVMMSATAGKVVLVNSTDGLNCNGAGAQTCNSAQLALIKDLVGYGNASFYEVSPGPAPAPALSNTTAGLRLLGGCTETDNNGADFVAGSPTPRNTATTKATCTPGAPALSSATGGDQKITVTWSAPSSNGGRAITDYEYRLDGTGGWSSLGLSSPADITGLSNGTTYGVEVRAVNAAGNGPASNSVSATPRGTPTPTPTPEPTAGKKVQKPANRKGVPPKRIMLAGLTVLQGPDARTNADKRIRMRVKGGPARSSAAGEVRYLTVVRGPKGKTSIRTYGYPNLRVVVQQKAPATQKYRKFTKKTVYVDGRR